MYELHYFLGSGCLHFVIPQKVKAKFTLQQVTKAQRGRHGSTLTLASVLDGISGQCHAHDALLPGKRPGTHRTGGWVGPTAGPDICRKSVLYTIRCGGGGGGAQVFGPLVKQLSGIPVYRQRIKYSRSLLRGGTQGRRYDPAVTYLISDFVEPKRKYHNYTPVTPVILIFLIVANVRNEIQ